MQKTFFEQSTGKKEKKSIVNYAFFIILAALFISIAPAKAQDEEIPVFTYKATALAFKNDSTINATEDGWSEWEKAKAVIIVDINDNLLKVVSDGTKRDYYLYEAEKTEDALIFGAVDYEGDDLGIKIQRDEDFFHIYFFYENFSYVYSASAS